MAYFAKLNSNNIVEQVISVHNNELLDNGIESEAKGIAFCKSLYGQDTNWKQTSYNTKDGKYHDQINNIFVVSQNQSKAFRKNFAGIGMTYDETRDAFIPIKQFNSWVLNEQKCDWEAPIPYPTDGEDYIWNEENQSWILIDYSA
jgi:hypothetical protein